MRIEDVIKQKAFKDEYNKVIVNMLYTNSWIISEQTRLIKPYGISQEQYNVLRILRGQAGKPITISSIQERMLNKMSNASRLVEKLKQKDMVTRAECPNDRRQVDVLITQKGLDLLHELDEQIINHNRSIIQLTEDETRLLNDLLDKLRG